MFDHTRIKRSLVAGMAIGVAAFPAAAQAEIYRAAGSGAQPSAAVSAPAHHLGPSTQTVFNWADAGIGAGDLPETQLDGRVVCVTADDHERAA